MFVRTFERRLVLSLLHLYEATLKVCLVGPISIVDIIRRVWYTDTSERWEMAWKGEGFPHRVSNSENGSEWTSGLSAISGRRVYTELRLSL